MYVLTVAYGHPANVGEFDDYYESTHLPLIRKLPGLIEATVRHCTAIDGSWPPYYLIAELCFPSNKVFIGAVASPEGRAAADDLAHFADSGVTLFARRHLGDDRS